MSEARVFHTHDQFEDGVRSAQQPEYMSSNQQTGYEAFDELIRRLRAEGFGEPAAKLHALLHETAWTTGSELLGELGLVIITFQRAKPATSDELKRHLDNCLTLVRGVWPKLGT